MKPREIIWLKRYDPLFSKDPDNHQIYKSESEVENFDRDEDDELFEVQDIESTPILMTPLGMVPVSPVDNPDRMFNFWLGQCSFPITEAVANIIDNCEGVEIAEVFLKYTFRISVGACWTFQEVRQSIEKALDVVPKSKKVGSNKFILDYDTKTKIRQLELNVSNKFKYWAILLLPNGEIDLAGSNEHDEEFEKRLMVYEQAKDSVGALVLRYDGEDNL